MYTQVYTHCHFYEASIMITQAYLIINEIQLLKNKEFSYVYNVYD